VRPEGTRDSPLSLVSVAVTGEPAGLELRRRAGLFRRVRIFERAAIRSIRMRLHDQALVADTLSGTELLTDLGTTAARSVVCQWLRNCDPTMTTATISTGSSCAMRQVTAPC
jgi:hypothetical protein